VADDAPPLRGGPQEIPRPTTWAPGRPAPWADLDRAARTVDGARVRRAFPAGAAGHPSPVSGEASRPSAVLVPLYEDVGGLHVVLTRRAWSLRTHRGEVSFPGGRAEPGEDHVGTALREAWEEIALDPSDVEALGELDHLTTVTRRSYIVPVVALLPGRPDLRGNDGEVDAVLHVPVSELLTDGVYREERWGTAELGRPVYFFELVGDTVWGATAAMLRQLLCRLTGVSPGDRHDLDPAGDLPGTWHLTDEQLRGVV
jgi:8-oxo-dGTP pyrophosphatase MutT (NUDIX family)